MHFDVADLCIQFFCLIFSLSVHEAAHAVMANRCGDPTARLLGRASLNPMAHIDPIGLAAVFLIGFGWGKPVQYNPYNLKWPKWGPVAVAVAGPMSNVLLGILSIVLIKVFGQLLGVNNLLTIFLFLSAQLNLLLLVFNLIPLPPLDGSKVLLAILAHPQYDKVRIFIEMRGPFILLCVILFDTFLNLGIFSSLGALITQFVIQSSGLSAFL